MRPPGAPPRHSATAASRLPHAAAECCPPRSRRREPCSTGGSGARTDGSSADPVLLPNCRLERASTAEQVSVRMTPVSWSGRTIPLWSGRGLKPGATRPQRRTRIHGAEQVSTWLVPELAGRRVSCREQTALIWLQSIIRPALPRPNGGRTRGSSAPPATSADGRRRRCTARTPRIDGLPEAQTADIRRPEATRSVGIARGPMAPCEACPLPQRGGRCRSIAAADSPHTAADRVGRGKPPDGRWTRAAAALPARGRAGTLPCRSEHGRSRVAGSRVSLLGLTLCTAHGSRSEPTPSHRHAAPKGMLQRQGRRPWPRHPRVQTRFGDRSNLRALAAASLQRFSHAAGAL